MKRVDHLKEQLTQTKELRDHVAGQIKATTPEINSAYGSSISELVGAFISLCNQENALTREEGVVDAKNAPNMNIVGRQ